MKDITIKIREVYLPFLLVSLGTILCYSLFRWLFDIKLGLLPLKEDLFNYWIPIFLPWIPVMLWLRRRLRFLNIKGKNDNGYFAYQIVIVIAIALPMIISQEYILKASFDLKLVESGDEIHDYPEEKYFSIKTFDVHKEAYVFHTNTRTSGKNNSRLNFYLFIATPFKGSNAVWYGVQYKDGVSNRASNETKQEAYKSFLEESEEAFADYVFYELSYFEKLGYSDSKDGFLSAIEAKNPDIDIKNQIILSPEKGRFEDRLGNTFPWIFGSFGIGAFILLVMVVIPKINKKEWDDFKKGRPIEEDELWDFIQYLNPRGPKKVTAMLLLLNLLVFVLITLYGINVASPTAQELVEIGGNRRTEVLQGEYWRLISSVFIHGGLTHLVMNLIGLGFAAGLLEHILGWKKLILSYVCCGFFASLASIFWYKHTVSVGASGAIFGLLGLIFIFTYFKIYSEQMRAFTWILVGLYVGGSMLMGFFGGIDTAAHLGGCISGCLLGGVFLRGNKQELIEKGHMV